MKPCRFGQFLFHAIRTFHDLDFLEMLSPQLLFFDTILNERIIENDSH